jgi:hypothetical protein
MSKVKISNVERSKIKDVENANDANVEGRYVENSIV